MSNLQARVIYKTYHGRTRANLELACDEFCLPHSPRMIHLMMIDLFVWGVHTTSDGTEFRAISGTSMITVRAKE